MVKLEIVNLLEILLKGITSINSSAVIFGPDGTQTNSGSTVDFVPNPYLRWETIGMTNLALDAGLFKNKLWITAEYYIKTTTDILWNPIFFSLGSRWSSKY